MINSLVKLCEDQLVIRSPGLIYHVIDRQGFLAGLILRRKFLFHIDWVIK
ncbi:MAG: hypothetical protein JWP78_704 [Mucilaginibacter sp.]|nr:hypothetical protein [Mucilaginibacter sp.]